MSGFDFDESDFLKHLDIKEKRALVGQKKGVQDSIDDLERISSGIAPIEKSTLRKSSNTEVKVNESGVIGEISFNATEKKGDNRFNYALWIHEMDYKLGESSSNAPGVDGYEVGNKYIERPLKGEAEKYILWMADGVARELD